MPGTNRPEQMNEGISKVLPPAFVQERLPPLMPNAALRWDVVSRLLPDPLGDVLEVGCGQGAVAARLARRANSLTALEPDLQSFAVAKARVGDRGQVLNMMSGELPAGDSFDLVCAFEVLEHIGDDAAALADWVARLRPGGTLLLSVPAHSRRFSDADRIAGHFRRYDRVTMQARLEQAGLIDIDICLYGFPSGYLLEAARNHLARRELSGKAGAMDIAERTATSGRMFQPGNALSHRAMSIASIPMIWLQRLFPDRGVGMLAMARKP